MSKGSGRKQKRKSKKEERSVFSQMDIDADIKQGLSEIKKNKHEKKEQSKQNKNTVTTKNSGIKKRKRRLYQPCRLGKDKLKGILYIINETIPDKRNKYYNDEKKADFTLSSKYADRLYNHQRTFMKTVLKIAGNRTMAANRKTLSKEDVEWGYKLYKELSIF